MNDRLQRSRHSSLWFLAVVAGVSFLAGTRPAWAHASGEAYGSCSCHSGGSGTTAATLGFASNPAATGAGDVLTLTVTNGSESGFGFSMQASAGSFNSTQPAGVRRYSATNVSHSSTSSTGVWTINWTAPASPTTVTFSVQALAVNGNGSTSGDKPIASAYTSSLTVSGGTQQDAGTAQHDAGTTQQDAAAGQQDSGAAGQDAGGGHGDGGIILTVPDGGSADAPAGGDGGNPPANAGGCAVASRGAAAGPLTLLVLVGLLAVRRRRR